MKLWQGLVGFLFAATPLLQPDRAHAADPAPAELTSLRAEAFEAAQRAASNGAATALRKVAARFAKGNDELARLEREREDLDRRHERAERQYLQQLAAGGPGPDALRTIRDELGAAVAERDRAIAGIDPSYFELTRPSVLALREVQELLDDDEALLFVLPAPDASYLFGVSRERVEWASTEALNEARLSGLVAALRTGLLEHLDPEVSPNRATFRSGTAYQLYQGLVAPVEEAFVDKKVLLVVGTGPLTTLPFHLLLTNPPPAEVQKVPDLPRSDWLIDRYALATLPAVSSLKAIRCLLGGAHERRPACAGTPARTRRSAEGMDLVGVGAPVLAPPSPDGVLKGLPDYARASQGELADTDFLRSLSSLPGAEVELQALEQSFKPDRALVRMGELATENFVKTSSQLKNARFVVFSTHGLLASQSGVSGEPGLVFTPPAESEKSADDDGLLTASEAAQLMLNADLLVLSACNTAASDGSPRAEGLSGLAKAFLFAGARSLLVSHWPVSDEATSNLMQRMFATLGADEQANGALALQSALKAVRPELQWPSPALWAPFVLVGTGD